jgi:hypothetical protein
MNDNVTPANEPSTKTRPIAELWRIVNPGPFPELASAQDALQAFTEGKITPAEVTKVQKAIERRSNKYLRSQGYDVD